MLYRDEISVKPAPSVPGSCLAAILHGLSACVALSISMIHTGSVCRMDKGLSGRPSIDASGVGCV